MGEDQKVADDVDAWSAVASEWAELWGSFAAPARRAVASATHIGPGSRVLDVGCGTGEFVELVADVGGIPSGIDPAAGMVQLARTRVRGADIQLGGVEALPWADSDFDVVTAVNALQFAEDTLEALAEMMRVAVPGGFLAVVNWAERSRNDLDVLEAAVSAAAGDEPLPDGDLRMPGGLESLFLEAGLQEIRSGVIPLYWDAAGEEDLVRGVLLGEDATTRRHLRATIVDAARPFRQADGSYRLSNAFRYAIGRSPKPKPSPLPSRAAPENRQNPTPVLGTVCAP